MLKLISGGRCGSAQRFGSLAVTSLPWDATDSIPVVFYSCWRIQALYGSTLLTFRFHDVERDPSRKCLVQPKEDIPTSPRLKTNFKLSWTVGKETYHITHFGVFACTGPWISWCIQDSSSRKSSYWGSKHGLLRNMLSFVPQCAVVKKFCLSPMSFWELLRPPPVLSTVFLEYSQKSTIVYVKATSWNCPVYGKLMTKPNTLFTEPENTAKRSSKNVVSGKHQLNQMVAGGLERASRNLLEPSGSPWIVLWFSAEGGRDVINGNDC